MSSLSGGASPLGTVCQVIVDGSASGVTNMARDEALLDFAARVNASDEPTQAFLRIYRWREPTVSIGYFQSIADRPAFLEALPAVRRLTAGGTLIHDHDITYSLVVAPGHWPGQDHRAVVREVHQIVLDFLRPRVALDQEWLQHGESLASPAAEPFLCFERRAPEDLVTKGRKFLGSAQRTRARALLQHGSFLLAASTWAPDLKGLGDTVTTLTERTVAEALAAGFADRFGWRCVQADYPVVLTDRVAMLETTRFGNKAWTHRR